MKSILIYCGSRLGTSKEFSHAAKELAQLLAEKNHKLIYGGGDIGLMGVISNTMLDLGAEVIGVIPQRLKNKEIANKRCSRLIVTKDMAERKRLMEEMADIIITLPGGLGSMDELFESWTNLQLGFHQKPIGILNTLSFYNPLLEQLKQMVEMGFMPQESLDKLKVSENPAELLKMLT